MIRLYLSVFFALFVLVVPKESVGQNGELAKLNEVKIVLAALTSEQKKLGLKTQAITDHALVLLRSKLPRLSVKDSAIPYVYININIGIGKVGGVARDYYGAIRVEIKRHVIINTTGKSFYAVVWDTGMRVTGPMNDAVDESRIVLELLLTQFAADWYRDNPAK